MPMYFSNGGAGDLAPTSASAQHRLSVVMPTPDARVASTIRKLSQMHSFDVNMSSQGRDRVFSDSSALTPPRKLSAREDKDALVSALRQNPYNRVSEVGGSHYFYWKANLTLHTQVVAFKPVT